MGNWDMENQSYALCTPSQGSTEAGWAAAVEEDTLHPPQFPSEAEWRSTLSPQRLFPAIWPNKLCQTSLHRSAVGHEDPSGGPAKVHAQNSWERMARYRSLTWFPQSEAKTLLSMVEIANVASNPFQCQWKGHTCHKLWSMRARWPDCIRENTDCGCSDVLSGRLRSALPPAPDGSVSELPPLRRAGSAAVSFLNRCCGENSCSMASFWCNHTNPSTIEALQWIYNTFTTVKSRRRSQSQ